MNKLEKYISEIIGTEISIYPLDKRLLQALPLYITSVFDIFETNIFEKRLCLLLVKTDNNITPDNLAKQKTLIEGKIGMIAVFVFDKILSYNIKRLIQKRINFIIPNKQMFVPALMLDLRKMPEQPPLKVEKLSSNAQFLLLFHLQKELLNGLTTQQLAEKFNQNYRTMSRAVNCLKDLNLIELVGGKEKQIFFTEKGKNLWQKAQPFCKNPVERTLFTDEILDYPKSNINALANYTMLNDEQKQFYAIDKQEVKNLTIETNKHYGDNEIEIWRYNPAWLAENGFVDKLSLFLLLKNADNERVDIELETLINEMQWLEE
ncbi:hypothetical protein FACS1894145_0110 [Bacteroidia bacterium]|nr:hypothetical protein FACS1894145_0110 [Bacteroidia bacterium]